jgi:N-acetylmuramoyl-L-alanine amidase
MKILNHLLYNDNGSQVPFKLSPNHGGVCKPEYIIIHYTASETASGAINWMLDPKAKVSANIHLDRAGYYFQLVPFNVTAWHAGKSEWKGLNGLNSHSIGIECQNTGKQEYTLEQLNGLVDACKAIVAAYPIKEILGHSDIAPGRKADPGKQFPMAWLREQVFGSPIVVYKLTSPMVKGETVKAIQKALGIPADGYFGKDTDKAVKEFQSVNGLKADGIVGEKTAKLLGVKL